MIDLDFNTITTDFKELRCLFFVQLVDNFGHTGHLGVVFLFDECLTNLFKVENVRGPLVLRCHGLLEVLSQLLKLDSMLLPEGLHLLNRVLLVD